MKIWDKGQRKYEKFIAKIGLKRRLMTPHTQTLELFAKLKGDDFIREALIELSKNFQTF